MNRFETWFADWVIRRRWWILVILPLLVMAAASGGRHLEFTNNYRVFFSAENPQLQAFENLERTYTQDDNVLFLLAPRDRDVYSNHTLEATEWLTEQSWQIPYSIRVDSITNFQHTEAQGDDLSVRDLAEHASDLPPSELARVREISQAEPLLLDRLVSETGHVTAVNITIQFPRVDENQEVPEVVSFARGLRTEFEQRYPQIDLYRSGRVLMNNAFAEYSRSDMQTLVPLSFAVMLLVLALLLRSLSAVLAVVLVIFMSVLTGMGLGGYAGFPLTPPSASAPTIILTMAIASSVHVLVTFFHEMRLGNDKISALRESLRINFQPVFLTSITTVIGFMSLNFSDAPPFRHLGNFVAFGVIATFLLSVSWLPALMSLLPVRVRASRDPGTRLMETLGDFVVRRRQLLLPGMALLVIGLVALVPQNELNDIFVEYFDESVEFRRHSDFLDENLGGLYRMDYSLDSGESNGVADPEFLARVHAFGDWWRSQPETVHVNVITDTFKRLNRNMHGDDPDWYRLPDRRDLAAQYLLLYEMSLPYGLDLNNQLDVDKQATRMVITMRILSTKSILEMEQRASEWLASNAPELQTQPASPTVMFAHIGERNIRSMLGGTTAALVLISMILMLALRSVKIGLVSLVPNLVPAAMAFGIWAIFVGQVGLALSVVTGMTLGIVVDDTVHFLSKYLRARRERGLASEDAVRYAFNSVGMALLVTSIVLIAGFLILGLSAFELNSGMGLLTAMVLALALLADFLFLPPLLMKIEEKTDAAEEAAAAREPA